MRRQRAVAGLLCFVVAAALAMVVPTTAVSYGAASSNDGLHHVAKTFAMWRSKVGHGSAVASARRARLLRVADSAVRPTHAVILRQELIAGANGPAIYLDLVSRKPVWTLRHASALVALLARKPFNGGWAIRLRNRAHTTVWIAGHAGNEGFVGSATPAIEAASPVSHF